MPHVRALWVTSAADGLDHLVLEDTALGATDQYHATTPIRALCGRHLRPAAMVCEPLPRCPRCRRQVSDPAPENSRPPLVRRLLSRHHAALPRSPHS